MIFVYVVAPSFDGPCKIGSGISPARRVAAYRAGAPWPIRIWATCQSSDGRELERAAHRELDAKRLSSEWFSVTVPQAVGVIHDLIARYRERPDLWKDDAMAVRLSDDRRRAREYRARKRAADAGGTPEGRT
jgi:hypothetical protein